MDGWVDKVFEDVAHAIWVMCKMISISHVRWVCVQGGICLKWSAAFHEDFLICLGKVWWLDLCAMNVLIGMDDARNLLMGSSQKSMNLALVCEGQ